MRYGFDLFNWGDNPNVQTKCWVVIRNTRWGWQPDPVIYLTEPVTAFKDERACVFETIFDARKWLKKQLPPNVKVDLEG